MENSNIEKDERLWKTAKRRAEFKRHLLTYIVVNLFLWSFWLVNSIIHDHFGFVWPVWVTLGWGIGLTFNYFGAYTGFKDSMTEREYQKLINKQNG